MIKNIYGFSKVGILVGIVVLGIAGFGIWRITTRVPTINIPTPLEDTDPTFVPVAWPMFFNTELGFTAQYPPNYRASGNVSIPLQLIEIPSENNPTPLPLLTSTRVEGDIEKALEHLRTYYVVEEIERLPYARYVKVVAREKERSEVRTEYFIRSNGEVSYIFLGWEGVDWKYTANVASSLEFE